MNTPILALIEILLCLGMSLLLISLLKPLLRDILIETCGTPKRAEFWLMFTQLMLLISPLLLVVFFIPTDPLTNINIAKAIKETLFRILLGDFIALAAIGRVIAKSIQISIRENQQRSQTSVKV
jgi:hypothetical protein